MLCGMHTLDTRCLQLLLVAAACAQVILFSAVRSNPARAVGFLADARRLNVALTRARRGLVVFGSASTLSADPTWAAWLAWVRQRGLVLDGEALLRSVGVNASDK